MKGVVLLASYTPTNREQDILRNLVRLLKNDGKDVLLMTHSETPIDIIKDVKYHFYDYDNELLYEHKYKNWYSVNFGNKLLVSKDVIPSSTHVLPCMRNLLFGLSISKMLGYDVAHYLEYDSIISDASFIDKNTELCVDYDGIYYSRESTFEQNNFNHIPKKHLLGSYCVFNLNSFSYEELKYNRESILDAFAKSLLVERITERLLIKDKNFLVIDVVGDSLENGLKENIIFSGKKIHPKILFIDDGSFHVYASHSGVGDSNEKVMIVVNENRVIMYPPIQKGMFYVNRLGMVEDVKCVKIFVNDGLILDYDFSTQESIEEHKLINFIRE